MDILLIWFLGYFSVVAICDERQTDERWIKQPESAEVVGFEGDSTTLQWTYKRPSSSKDGRLLLTHQVNGKDYFEFLIDATINHITGSPSFVILKDDKVELIINETTLSLRLLSVERADAGNYSLSIKFDNSPIRDTFALHVYARPEITESPGAEITKTVDSHVLLRYLVKPCPDCSTLTRVTFILAPDNDSSSRLILVEAQRLDTNQWQVIYPDDQQLFKDRISFQHDEPEGLMKIGLWDLKVEDSGRLIFSATYQHVLAPVSTETLLTVERQGFSWTNVPPAEIHAVKSHDIGFTFTASHELESPKQLIKYRIHTFDKGKEHEKLYLEANLTEKTQDSKLFSDRMICRYHRNNNTSTLVVNITDASLQDATQYSLNMYYGNRVVLRKIFKLVVLSDQDLVPDVRLDDRRLDQTNWTTVQSGGSYRFSIQQMVPAAALMTLFVDGDQQKDELFKVYNARALAAKLTSEQLLSGITLHIDYDFFNETVKLGGSKLTKSGGSWAMKGPCSDVDSSTHIMVMYTLVIVTISCLILILGVCWLMCSNKKTLAKKSKFKMARSNHV